MPTHLLYEAWKKSVPILQHTKDAKGNEITRKIEFVDPMQNKDMESHHGHCFLCGQPMEQGIKIKKVFSNVFTDWNQAKCPTETHVCPSCSFTILTNKKQRYGIRTFTNVANKDHLWITNRKELRTFMLDPPDPPFVMNLAVSQKKHIAFKGEANYSKEIYSVMYEEMPVLVNREKFKTLLELVENFLYGFTKTEILTGKYNQKRILDFGIEEWESFEEQIEKYRGNSILDVIMFVAQKVEEEETLLCFMDSVLKIKKSPVHHSLFMPSIEAETGEEDHQESICGDKLSALQNHQLKEPQQLELF